MSEPLPRPSVQTWDFPRSVASVALLARFAAEHGLERERLLRGVPLEPGMLDEPDGALDARTELAVVDNLVTVLGDLPGLGLAAGSRYRVTTFGIFGFACISSTTMRDAMAFALRYLDLSFTFCLPRVAVVGDEVRLTLDDTFVPARLRRFLVERDLAAIHRVMHDLLTVPPPLRSLQLRYPRPGYAELYERHFGLAARFGAETNLATLHAGLLDRPLPQANEHTVALCEQQCRALLDRRRARAGIAGAVRERLVRAGGAPSGIDEIARRLAVSTRTLRRRLAEEGTSYRALLDEVRHALAEELLRTGALRVEDVAARLGYAESSSFIYAFKRWTGRTPSSFMAGAEEDEGT